MSTFQYSFVPSEFDNKTIAICRKYTELHANQTEAILTEIINDDTSVNPPIWWINSTNQEVHKINDNVFWEILLVVLVIVKEAIFRDAYLPVGTWLDNRNTINVGSQWLRNYPAFGHTLILGQKLK